jgi:hypothetical protein
MVIPLLGALPIVLAAEAAVPPSEDRGCLTLFSAAVFYIVAAGVLHGLRISLSFPLSKRGRKARHRGIHVIVSRMVSMAHPAVFFWVGMVVPDDRRLFCKQIGAE